MKRMYNKWRNFLLKEEKEESEESSLLEESKDDRLTSISKRNAEKELNEGAYDQNIFKVVFLAGGSGSGKSFVARQVTSGQGWKVVNSDVAFEYLLGKEGMSLDMTSYSPEEYERSQEIRARAKKITGRKMAGYITNRLGMIIDGTGADYDKMESLRNKFDEIGYDSFMVFVNTSLKAARAANKKRARTVPDNILNQTWAAAQENMGKFQNLFGKDNFAIVDNTRDPESGRLGAPREILDSLWKEIGKFSLRAPESPKAQKWIEKERGESDVPLPRSRTLGEEYVEESKDDRCTRIAKRKYDVWPSAYASGAVVKCRQGKIWKDLKEEEDEEIVTPEEKKEIKKIIVKLKKASKAHAAQATDLEGIIDEKKKKKKVKTDYSKEKKSGLHGWFSRQGGKGKSSGWVDCNTCRKDPKTGRKKCKACGREKGEKRAKYPSCRPTPSACGTAGKGKKWGKKSEGLRYHIDNEIGIEENIYRPGSKKYFELFQEVRRLHNIGLYELKEAEEYFINELDIGEYGIFEGKKVPLDYPMLDEAKYKGKEVKLGAAGAKRSGDGRAHVYVRDPKSGNIRKVSFGSSMPDAMGDSPEAKKRRKNFGERHGCADKKDKTKAGYWACRATKMFGRNIPGWW